MTKKEYQKALARFMVSQPLLGQHTMGGLTVIVGHRAWEVTDGAYFHAAGKQRTAEGLRLAIARAVNQYIKVHAR